MSTPRFTRQHFEFIADTMHRGLKAVQRTGDSHVLAQYEAFFIPSVAEDLAETNPKFDKDRFTDACLNGVS